MAKSNDITNIILTFAAIATISSYASQAQTKAPTISPTVIKETKAIAHKGAWKKLRLPGNSIAAFRQSVNLKCAGSEFDVNITADDSLVISHGPMYHGLPLEKTTQPPCFLTR